MENVILVVHLLLALSMIAVVLLQRSEGGGLGMGSSGGGAPKTGRAGAGPMTTVTWILAAAFIVTSISLTVVAAQKAGNSSVVDGISVDDLTPPVVPTDSLLPPALDDGSLTPPAAE
jgi:preprotein translocase subunit SecG